MPLIALEGIDKSGKKTQTQLLARRLAESGLRAEPIAFPDYRTPLGLEIKSFLEGSVVFRPEVRQLLFVANRWERESDISGWLRERRFVIADRYIPAGLVYGLANGLSLDWMLKLEEGLPRPDMVIVLDLSPRVTALRSGRKDIYERDLEFQQRVRELYLQLGKSFEWQVVNGEQPVKRVAEQVWDRVSRIIDIT
jgi:dTMP kinase